MLSFVNHIWAIAFVLLQACLVFGDISITSPAAGATFTSSSTITIEIADTAASPSFAQIAAVTVLLCTGPNADINCFYTGIKGETLAALGTSIPFPITPAKALASNGLFYFQIYSTTTTGGDTIHYSERFSLTGMTGTLQATSGGDETPPNPVVNLNLNINPLTANTVPYTLQTGLTKYAPMQQQPVSKVTLPLSASRRHPTSAVSYFTTYSQQPIQITTITPSITYSISQYVNYAAVAPNPTVAGYYAASEALSRTINAKSRRGYVDL